MPSDTALVAGLSALLGLLVGSFLNVVIWRVPRGESVLHPPSACPGCGAPIRPRDNIPVVSWLILRGRCRDCGEPISARYPLVEGGTALLCGLVAWAVGPTPALPAWLFLALVGVALAMIDIDHHRLPDVMVLPSYAVAGALFLVPAALEPAWGTYGRAWLGAAALFAFYFALAFAYPAGMGFGDVKLAGVLGLYLGWLGWPAVLVGTFAAFLLGAVVGLVVVKRSGGGRGTAVPFGPFMLAGVIVALLWADPIASWYGRLLGG